MLKRRHLSINTAAANIRSVMSARLEKKIVLLILKYNS